MKFLLFGSGDVAKNSYLVNSIPKNIEFFWAYNPEWDEIWSVKEIHSPKELIHKSHHLFEINTYQELISLVEKIKPDIGLVVGSRWILNKDLISKFKNSLFNYHPSCLPLYRGAGGFSWQILHKETEACVTIHKLVQEVDTGEIVLQRKRFVGDNPTPQDFINVINDLASETIASFISEIGNGNTFENLQQQNQEDSTYFPGLQAKINGAINWNWNGKDIETFVKAFSFPYSGMLASPPRPYSAA